MEDLEGKVAVITGAASGIGAATAMRLAAGGARLVLGDVEEEPLRLLTGRLAEEGAETVCVCADVSEVGDVEALLAKGVDHFGSVDVVCNNAGVGLLPRRTDRLELIDWEWVLQVNLWGVINGIRVFLPYMLARNRGHIVNMGSVQGLMPVAGMTPYCASKYAVVAISECIAQELAESDSDVAISVICPGVVATRLVDAGRNRPRHLTGTGTGTGHGDAKHAARREQVMRNLVSGGADPSVIAELVVQAIRTKRLYLSDGKSHAAAVRSRHRAVEAALAGVGERLK